jgi:DNA-binding MarR family transcriptional regulator
MQPSEAISYYLQHLAVLLGRQSDQVLQEQLGIGISQYRILQALQTNPSVQQKQLASLLGQTEASVSRQIKLMQGRGMLEAQVNPQNRREHLTTLQPKGERLLAAGAQVLVQYHEPGFVGLNQKEQAKLSELLEQLHAGMCSADTR